jgi:hypothetical protein
MADEAGKIIIDEDWKAQVQREREQVAQAIQQPAEDAVAAEEEVEPDKPNFSSLVQMLSMEALSALGAFPAEGSTQVMVDLDHAQALIELLLVLREKTKGNLTPEEDGLLTRALAEIQQGYVVRSQQLHESELRRSGIDPTGLMGG